MPVIVRFVRLNLYKGRVRAFTLIEYEQEVGQPTTFGVGVHFYCQT
jgi:hypothetical protein